MDAKLNETIVEDKARMINSRPSAVGFQSFELITKIFSVQSAGRERTLNCLSVTTQITRQIKKLP